jgi:hypothetical protein
MGNARVIAGMALVTEVGDTVDRCLRTTLALELARLTRFRLLVDRGTRIRLEVQRRGRIPDDELFEPRIVGVQMVGDALAGKSRAREWKRRWASAENQSRDLLMVEQMGPHTAVQQALNDNDPVLLFQRARRRGEARRNADRDAAIDRICRTMYFETEGARFGVGDPQSLTARDVPTARADVAYSVSRADTFALGARGTPPAQADENDVYDNFYFIDAVYADLLVTDDGGLRDIANDAGNTGIRLVRFAEWAAGFAAHG